MKKLLLLDGNSMLFRAFYATIYTRPMRTSTNIPTNAIYAFVLMLNKAIDLLQVDHILVAWDTGKPTFRHKLAPEYKGTRKQLPEELIAQFPIAREFLSAANIAQYEQEGLEADDIIGTIATQFKDYDINILTSDRDMLQLIDDNVKVVLMKKGISDMDVIDAQKLKDWMNVTPAQIVDLKALMGDTADNIKGVAGIGVKTAEKLINEFHTIENLYANIDTQKGKLKEKLVLGKEDAFISKTLATIIRDATLTISEEDFKYVETLEQLNDFYRKYEFNSFIKKEVKKISDIKIVNKIDSSLLNEHTIVLFQHDNEHFLNQTVYGLTISNQQNIVYIALDDLLKDENALQYFKEHEVITYNAKLAYHLLDCVSLTFKGFKDDIMLMSFLVNSAASDYEKFVVQYNLTAHESYEKIFGKKGKPLPFIASEQTSYLMNEMYNMIEVYPRLIEEIQNKKLTKLYYELELPLSKTLYRMEAYGITTSKQVLDEIGTKTVAIIEAETQIIYDIAGREFNINSPKQLAEVLFDELQLKVNKKRSTAIDVLEKLEHTHPIISHIIRQRKYQKLYSTYAIGLAKHICEDGKIHTTFNQVIAATGRLSSVDPNLQNISAKDEDAKEIRRAFTASENRELLSFDYSQIELRVIADMANETQMIEDFNNGLDIHSETAKKVFGVDEVDSHQRRFAKAVNFGIIYGMSDFGLSQQLHIPLMQAKKFIERYFETYPNIRQFMDNQIAFCKENGYVETLYGRRRDIPEINDKNKMIVEFAKRAAMNTPIQGSAADIIKLAMIKIDEALKSYNTKMILQVHDELVFDCDVSEKEAVYELIQSIMVQVVNLKVKLEVDGRFGLNYYETK